MLKVLVAIISSASLLAIVHYVACATFWPKVFLDRINRERASVLLWVYFALAFIGGATILLSGFRTLLFWIPSSFGTHDENGDFTLLRDSIASTLALLIVPMFGFIYSAARNKVAVESTKEQSGAA